MPPSRKRGTELKGAIHGWRGHACKCASERLDLLVMEEGRNWDQ